MIHALKSRHPLFLTTTSNTSDMKIVSSDFSAIRLVQMNVITKMGDFLHSLYGHFLPDAIDLIMSRVSLNLLLLVTPIFFTPSVTKTLASALFVET